ncbi:group I intron-associated PD-(D/E)XK endonuclease [Paenibacillus naphthalenovorans]|uniref:group I intron-associated PD-(D/E)XK endonuclease n=1 Tax=Paenibacillus naphthalenovorans TaxID=162209 RepID=UPI003D2701EF
MFESTLKGVASEKLVEVDLLLQGYEIFTPSAYGGTYDLLAVNGSSVYRVQVKSATPKDDKLDVDVRRSSHSRTGRDYPEDGYDVLAIANLVDRKVAYVRRSEMTARSSIKVWLTRNIPTKGRHIGYKPYVFDDMLEFPA